MVCSMRTVVAYDYKNAHECFFIHCIYLLLETSSQYLKC